MNTPVLFTTFARPEYARQAFEHIRKAKPKKLYFYSNKARSDRPEEIDRNNQVRSLVNEIDWDCEVKTWFRDEYVDVYVSTHGATQWLFDNEEQGIVLEEDCIACPAFFEFCEHFLNVYRDDHRIAFISGNNYVTNYDVKGHDHIVNRFFALYGLATWRDRWNRIDFNISTEECLNNKYAESYFQNRDQIKYWNKTLTHITDFQNRTHCWDYAFVMNCIKNGKFGISPIVHLIQNIGIHGAHANDEASPTQKIKYVNLQHYPFTGEPINDFPDEVFTAQSYRIIMTTFSQKVYNKLMRISKRIKKFTHLNSF